MPDLKLCRPTALLVTVITSREGLFEPAVQDHEQVTGPHLLDPKLGDARLSVAPGIRQHRVTVPADDAFQRQLNRQVEMLGQDWLDARDRGSSV